MVCQAAVYAVSSLLMAPAIFTFTFIAPVRYVSSAVSTFVATADAYNDALISLPQSCRRKFLMYDVVLTNYNSPIDAKQMTLDLDSLFHEEPGGATEPESATYSASSRAANTTMVYTVSRDEEIATASLLDNDFESGQNTDTGLPFGMRVDTYAENAIKLLIQERDAYKAESDKLKKAYDELDRRVYRKVVLEADLPAEMVHRLNRLDNETERYRAENIDLRKKLKVTEGEAVTLRAEVTNQKNKLKGAGKKVRNAKDLAGKEEDKAKTAVHNQQLRADCQKKMKQERNEAKAEAQSLRKLCEDLQADLQVERSGRPHLRQGLNHSETTAVVIPIELTIHRADFLKLSTVFESNQIAITEQIQRWYKDWKKPKEATRQVVGANYTSNKERGKAAVNLDKLYADMIELVDGHQQTGAEHDGPRSRDSLETTCRRAEERHNCED